MITTSVQMQMFGKFAEQKNNPGNDIIHLQSNAVAMINCFIAKKLFSTIQVSIQLAVMITGKICCFYHKN